MAVIDISAKILGDEQLSTMLRDLSAHDIPKAINAGVRYAAGRGKTRLAKEVGGVTPVKAARLKQDLHVSLASDGQTAQIWASSQPMSALQFKPRQTRAGLNLTLYKSEKTLIKSGFMQISRAQRWRGKLPFKPTTDHEYTYDRTRKQKRKGMEFVFGLSLASIYLGGKHAPRIQAAVEELVSEALVKGILDRLGAMARGYGKA